MRDITDWYSIEQAILWNILLIDIHWLIVYYLSKKQLLIKKKKVSKFQSWKFGVERLHPISALSNSYVKCRAERKPEVFRVHPVTSACELSALHRFVLCWKAKGWWGYLGIIWWFACTCKLGKGKAQVLLGSSLQFAVDTSMPQATCHTATGSSTLSSQRLGAAWDVNARGLKEHCFEGRKEGNSLNPPCATCPGSSHLVLGLVDVWYEGVTVFQKVSDPSNVAIQVTCCVKWKTKSLSSNTKWTWGSSTHLSEVSGIWASPERLLKYTLTVILLFFLLF